MNTLNLFVALAMSTANPFTPAAHPPPPPPQAFEACADAAEGQACTVETPHGTVKGTCERPRGDQLVCVPEGAPPPRRE